MFPLQYQKNNKICISGWSGIRQPYIESAVAPSNGYLHLKIDFISYRNTDKQHNGHLENPIYDGSVVSHTVTSVRDTQNIQTTTTNEGQEVDIYDVPEVIHTRKYEESLNQKGGISLYAIPEKTR